MSSFEATLILPVSAQDAYDWHVRPGAFGRLNPPWEHVDVVERHPGVYDGAVVKLRIRKGPVRIHWTLQHRDVEAGRRFVDEQLKGPFGSWVHTHAFDSANGTATLRDHIEYDPPMGALGSVFAGGTLRSSLERLFAYRHAVTRDDLALHARFAEKPRLTVAITGSSGLIGSALCDVFTTGGHTVRRLVRRPAKAEDEIQWDPQSDEAIPALNDVDVIIHLAGENIASGRWTEDRKRRIRDSRVVGTRSLAAGLHKIDDPPTAFISASAMGFYGRERGEDCLTEDDEPGESFLAEVCTAWEAAAEPARELGLRVVHARIGVVLSPRGGALAKMLPAARTGTNAIIGHGRQFLSWVSQDDVVSGFYTLAMDDGLEGPFNLTAPQPASNEDFTRSLARVLHRPQLLRVPSSAVNALLGEMGGLLTDGACIVPSRLRQAGFEFRYPTLELALRHLLGKASRADEGLDS